ncbi:hypothetical protein LIER_10266 [Lithospermum erythrorhizon]|uniref:Uncharacterized protein n=1 Tax=Lithospermum erythrorhizon TaxID=34254 RepID=A0AAV3PKN1_LITER
MVYVIISLWQLFRYFSHSCIYELINSGSALSLIRNSLSRRCVIRRTEMNLWLCYSIINPGKKGVGAHGGAGITVDEANAVGTGPYYVVFTVGVLRQEEHGIHVRYGSLSHHQLYHPKKEAFRLVWIIKIAGHCISFGDNYNLTNFSSKFEHFRFSRHLIFSDLHLGSFVSALVLAIQ